MYDEAAADFLRSLELFGVKQDNIDSLRASYTRGGFESFCRTQIDLLHIRAQTEYVSPVPFATTFAYLNEPDSVFHYLDMGFRERSISYVKSWPPFQRFKSDPRFSDLLRRMNLPE
jgi:hypothetical protein